MWHLAGYLFGLLTNRKDMGKDNTKKEQAKEQAKEQTKEQAKEQKTAAAKTSKGDAAQKQIAELNDKLSKEHDDYVRLMAEFETFRRRSAEEKLNLVGSAASDTIKGLLPVLDDCERAMEMLASSSDDAAKEGTALIYNKLMDYLKTRGLSVIEAKGETFNTDFHEAVTQFPAQSEEQKGKVIDVIQTGYTLNGKVIRYAKVVVGV